MKGKIVQVVGKPNPNSYKIRGEDGNVYHAHVGDVEQNENILFELQENRKGIGEILILAENDPVEFDLTRDPHAFHVKKISGDNL